MRNLLRTFLPAAALVLPLLAQATADSTIVGKESKPHQLSITTGTPLPAADQQQLIANLDRIRAALRATPALSQLHGYDWETFARIHTEAHSSAPARAVVGYVAFPYWKNPRTGQLEPSEEGPSFKVHINDPEVLLPNGLYDVDQQAHFALEPRRVGEIDGFPMYDGNFIVMTRGGQPLFVPVTQQQYLQRQIEKQRADLAEISKRFRNQPENPQVQQADIDSRLAAITHAREENEKRWALMERWPGRVAAERARYDAREKQQLQEVDDLRHGTPQERYLQTFEARLTSLESELASLGPDERSASALNPASPNKDRPSGLAPPGVHSGRRIVTVNPALFDRSRSRAAVQLVILGTTRYFPELYDEVQRQLDKTVLVGMMD